MFVDDPAQWWELVVVGGREWYPATWSFLLVLKECLSGHGEGFRFLRSGLGFWVAPVAEFLFYFIHGCGGIAWVGAYFSGPKELAIGYILYLSLGVIGCEVKVGISVGGFSV